LITNQRLITTHLQFWAGATPDAQKHQRSGYGAAQAPPPRGGTTFNAVTGGHVQIRTTGITVYVINVAMRRVDRSEGAGVLETARCPAVFVR
jgi:hypothetical protein